MPKIRRKRNNFSITTNTNSAVSATGSVLITMLQIYADSSVVKIKDNLINFKPSFAITNTNYASLFELKNANNALFLFGIHAANNDVLSGNNNITKTISNKSSSNVEYSNSTYYSIGIKDEYDWVNNNLTSSSNVSLAYSGGVSELNGLLYVNFYLPVITKINSAINNLSQYNPVFDVSSSLSNATVTLTQDIAGDNGNKSILFFETGENAKPAWLSINSFTNGQDATTTSNVTYTSAASKSGVVSKAIKKIIKDKSYFCGSLPYVKNITGNKLINTTENFNDDKTLNFDSYSNNSNYITGKSITKNGNNYNYISLPEYDTNADGLNDTSNTVLFNETNIFSLPNEIYGIEDFNFTKVLNSRDLKGILKQERFNPDGVQNYYYENSSLLERKNTDFYNKNIYENENYDITKRKEIKIEIEFSNDAELKFNKYTKYTSNNTAPTTSTFSPNNISSFQFTKGLQNPVTISSDYTPTAYFNFSKNRWDYLYYNDEKLDNENIPYFTESSGVYTLDLINTNKLIGNLPICFSPSYYTNQHNTSNTSYLSIPTRSYGFPQKGNWKPLEDHYLKMSDYIDEDFILEKVIVEGVATSYGEPTEYNNDTSGVISNSFNFFLLNQRDNFNLSLRDRCIAEDYNYNFSYNNKYTQNGSEVLQESNIDHLNLTVDGIGVNTYNDVGEPEFSYLQLEKKNKFKTKNNQNNDIIVDKEIKDDDIRELITYGNFAIWNKYSNSYESKWDTIKNNFDNNIEVQQTTGLSNAHINVENFNFRIETDLKYTESKSYEDIDSKYSFYVDVQETSSSTNCPSSLISIKEGESLGKRNIFNLNTSDRNFTQKSKENTFIINSPYILKPEDNLILGINAYANGNLLSTVFKIHKNLRISLIGRPANKDLPRTHESYAIRKPVEGKNNRKISNESFRLIKDSYIDKVFKDVLTTNKEKDFVYYVDYFDRKLLGNISAGKNGTFSNSIAMFEFSSEKNNFISDSVLASPYKIHSLLNCTIRDPSSNSNISPANINIDNKLILGSDFSSIAANFTDGVVSNSWTDGNNPSWINNKWYYTFPFESNALSNTQNNEKTFFENASDYGINGFAINDNAINRQYFTVSTPDNLYKDSDVIKKLFGIEKNNTIFPLATENNFYMMIFGIKSKIYNWRNSHTYKNLKGYVYTPQPNDETIGISEDSLREVEVYIDLEISSTDLVNTTTSVHAPLALYEENIAANISSLNVYDNSISNGDIIIFFEPNMFETRKFNIDFMTSYGGQNFFTFDSSSSTSKTSLFSVPHLKLKYSENVVNYDYTNFPLADHTLNSITLWNNENSFKFNDGRSVTHNSQTSNLPNFSTLQKYNGSNAASASANTLSYLSTYNLSSNILSDFTQNDLDYINNNEIMQFNYLKKIFYSFNTQKDSFPVIRNEGFKYGVYNSQPVTRNINYSWNSWGQFADKINESKNYAMYSEEGIKTFAVEKKFVNEYYINITESNTQYTYNKDVNCKSNYPFIEDKENSLNSGLSQEYETYFI